MSSKKSVLQNAVELYANEMLPHLKAAYEAGDFGEPECDMHDAGFVDIFPRLKALLNDVELIAKGDWRLEDTMIER